MRAFVICLLFLIGVINAGPRESIIKKTQTLISSFFSESQLEKIFDLKEKYEYAEMNAEMMELMSPEQYTTFADLLAKAVRTFKSAEGLQNVTMRCFDSSMPVIQPLKDKLRAAVKEARKAGKNNKEINDITLEITDEAFTKEFAKEAMEACKSGIGPEDWKKVKSLLGKYIKFSAMEVD